MNRKVMMFKALEILKKNKKMKVMNRKSKMNTIRHAVPARAVLMEQIGIKNALAKCLGKLFNHYQIAQKSLGSKEVNLLI